MLGVHCTDTPTLTMMNPLQGPGGGRAEVSPSWARPALTLGQYVLQVDLITLEKLQHLQKPRTKGESRETIAFSIQYTPSGKNYMLISTLFCDPHFPTDPAESGRRNALIKINLNIGY